MFDLMLPLPLQELQSRQQSGGMRLLERSVWSDRMVFVRAVLEANWMDKMELSVYDSWCVAYCHLHRLAQQLVSLQSHLDAVAMLDLGI